MALIHLHQASYQHSEIQDTINRGFKAFGGVKQALGSRQKLLLKPNFLISEPPGLHTVTQPEVILGLVDFLLEHGYQPSIGESPAWGSTEQAIAALGIDGELKKRGVPFFSFKKLKYERTQGPQTPLFSRAAELDQYDGLINLPKVKTHCQYVLTGATKNLFGLVVGKRKGFHHVASANSLDRFTRMLLDNAQRANPLFTLADGITAMHRKGPSDGDPYPLHCLLLGNDHLEMDWFITELLGVNPLSIPLFQVAAPQKPTLLEGDPYQIRQDFELASQVPIGFTPMQFVRSVIKNLRILMQPT